MGDFFSNMEMAEHFGAEKHEAICPESEFLPLQDATGTLPVSSPSKNA